MFDISLNSHAIYGLREVPNSICNNREIPHATLRNRLCNFRYFNYAINKHFISSYTEICGPLEDRFLEKDGRELFLLYLKPIINGTGNYYIEAQTRDQTRTDVIIDYLGVRYIIEMKIWHGDSYNKRGEDQLCEYLDYFGLNTGYMLSFNFNKKKKTGINIVTIRNKVLFEAVL